MRERGAGEKKEKSRDDNLAVIIIKTQNCICIRATMLIALFSLSSQKVLLLIAKMFMHAGD